jgi:hypothetical protein
VGVEVQGVPDVLLALDQRASRAPHDAERDGNDAIASSCGLDAGQ